MRGIFSKHKISFCFVLVLNWQTVLAQNKVSSDSVYYEYKYAYTMEMDSSFMEDNEFYMYIEKFAYPEVKGIRDTSILNKINDAISGDIRLDMQESFLSKELKYVDQAIYDKLPYPRNNSSGVVHVLEFNPDFITYSEFYEWDGGAHPSFSYNGTFSISLKTGELISIGDILNDGWQPYYAKAAMSNESLQLFTSDGIVEGDPCEDVLDGVLMLMKEFTDKTPIAITKDGLLIYSADFRDFHCPEIMRNVFEIVIPLAEINALLKPQLIRHVYLKK